MRILHVIDSLDPDMGGLPRAALSLACAQALAGHAVGILYYECAGEEGVIQDVYGMLPGFEQVQKIPMRRTSRISWLRGKKVRPNVRDFHPDVVHTHGLWEPMLRQAHAVAVSEKIPYFITPHGMMHPWQDNSYRLLKWVLIHPLGWGRYWRRAACALALTGREAEHFRARGCFSRVEVLPNGIFAEEAQQEGNLPSCFGLGPYVLFLGRLCKGKGPDLLLEAFGWIAEEFPDHRLILAGPDYGMGAWLRARAASLGLRKRVCLPGTLHGAEKWAALREAACYCMPSRAEGFGLSLLEAGLAGTPILQSDTCWFRGLVEEDGAVSFELSVEALGCALAEILTNPQPHAADALILKKYTWPKVAAELDVLLQEILEKG